MSHPGPLLPLCSICFVAGNNNFLFYVCIEPEKETNNILLIVGISAGVLIFIAILIPLVVFMCRNCCMKGVVAPDKDKQEDKTKSTKKVRFNSRLSKKYLNVGRIIVRRSYTRIFYFFLE